MASPAQFSSVQSLSRVQLLATPWTAAHQVSLSINSSQSLLKLLSMKSVMFDQLRWSLSLCSSLCASVLITDVHQSCPPCPRKHVNVLPAKILALSCNKSKLKKIRGYLLSLFSDLSKKLLCPVEVGDLIAEGWRRTAFSSRQALSNTDKVELLQKSSPGGKRRGDYTK